MSWTRNLRAVGIAALILAVAAVSILAHPGPGLTAFGDILALALQVIACVVMLRNVFAQSRSRAFWSLLSLGCVLWTINTALWAYYEVILRQGDEKSRRRQGDSGLEADRARQGQGVHVPQHAA